MKKKTVKKPISVTRAKKKAWDMFSKYIRLRDAIETTGTKTHALCITCGRRYPIFGVGCLQAGHFIPGRKNAVLIDEIGVNAQCYVCNTRLKGSWVEYEAALIKKYGHDIVEELKSKKTTTVQIKAYQWIEVYEEYKKKFDLLS